MSASAPLRLVASRAEAPTPPPPIRASLAWRPAPPLGAVSAVEKSLLVAAAATFVLHAAVLAWMTMVAAEDVERSAGAGADLILLEGIPVELVQSMPAPEIPPAEAAPETPPEEIPPEPVEDVTEPPPPEPVPEPMTEPPPPEPEPVVAPPPQAEPTPAVDEALPPAEAETGDLPARPDEPPPAAEPPPEEPPPPEETAEPEGPPPPDPATVPTPRVKPERTEVAEKPPEPKPEQPKPAAPPPSAPSAPSTAARSGGAGGGGAAQTAGRAEASAYRAKVAAQLARKRFYPNAARRDRLTGRATVSFTLNASGKVTSVKVVRSAGSRILDDAAIEMVRRASPYPPIPRGLGATITIQAPIDFALPR